MQPFRKNLAIAIDGGGIRGVVVTQALTMLENALQVPLHRLAGLTAGTSTGAIIAAGIASGMTASHLNHLYLTLGSQVFPTTWRKVIFPLTRYRYPSAPLETFLRAYFGNQKMSDYWQAEHPIDVVITAYDLKKRKNLFIKSWKEEYAEWEVVKAVQSSCTVPTYFPLVEGRYIDGGVGSYANPCYLAAYEASFILQWDPAETTLISLGTGREPYRFDPLSAPRYWAWDWLSHIFGVFLHSAEDQQVQLVKTFFDQLDFRRFQVDMDEPIEMDDVRHIDRLIKYGEILGSKILSDRIDPTMKVVPPKPEE